MAATPMTAMPITNVGAWFRRSAAQFARLPAIHFRDTTLTYAGLEDASNRFANAIAALGVTRGERVAVYLENCPEVVVLELGCYKGAFVKAPVNARLAPAEVRQVLDNAGATVLVTSAARVAALGNALDEVATLRHIMVVDGETESGRLCSWTRRLAAARADCAIATVTRDDLAVLHYTSGSSGVLKAAMQTFGNRLAVVRKFISSPDGRVLPGDLMGLVGPITHASGMQMMPVLVSGGALRLFERFDPAGMIEAIARYGITHTFMVPTMINMILALPAHETDRMRGLKRLGYGASPMAPARIREAMERFGPILMQGYGAGETTSGVTTLSIRDHIEALQRAPERLASCGRPYYETEVAVVDADGQPVKAGESGEIVVRGDDVFAGYWNAPDLTAEVLIDGWYHTGDVATVDEEGFLYIVDRKKDMIITGGFNVYPSEVERVLYEHPAVYEACVVAMPDEQWGEAVAAEVVLRAGQTLTADALQAFCAERLARFKQPRSVTFVAALPKNQNGKLSRRDVQARYWEGRSRRVN